MLSKAKRQSRPSRKVAPAVGVKLSLFVSGLCAFVNYKDQHGVDRMKVVMPNTEDAMPGMEDPIHTAVLLVSNDRITSGTRQPQFRFDGTVNGYRSKDMAGFLLRHEDVSVADLDPANPVLPLMSATPPCPPASSPFGFDWIQSMPAGSAKMKRSAFDRSTKEVMATLDLFDGELFTSLFPADHTGNDTLKWFWDTPAGGTPTGTPRAIAEEIKFFRSFTSAASVTVNLGGDSIVLSPNPMRILEMWVANLPLIDILINRSAGAAQDRGPEFHFSHFHGISSSPGVLIPWPHRTDKCSGNPTGDAANPKCPPVFFSSVG